MSYFNFDRKRKAIEDIATCYECAEKAGIKDKLFINFGLLLGIVRENDFIGNDDDVDICVQADDISKKQQEEYINYLDDHGLFFAREKKVKRKDKDMYTWFSLRKEQDRAKFCHWFGFNWSGYYWWSKGRKWVRASKFDETRWGYSDTDQGIALGIPSDYVKKLIWIKFKGIKIQIPEKYGHVLDWEYPGWPIPQSGSSRKQVVCIIPKWDTPRDWKIKPASLLLP
ncbi:MAG: hypothetical protein ACWGNI_00160 [Desulfobacterales bacterium]